jgi:hypothetical protein
MCPAQQKVSIQSRDDVDDGASSKLTDGPCRNTVFARSTLIRRGQSRRKRGPPRMKRSGPHWGTQEREVLGKGEKAGSVVRQNSQVPEYERDK